MYRDTHLMVWGPPVTVCLFRKDGYQVFFRFLCPAPDTGLGTEQALPGLRCRGVCLWERGPAEDEPLESSIKHYRCADVETKAQGHTELR